MRETELAFAKYSKRLRKLRDCFEFDDDICRLKIHHQYIPKIVKKKKENNILKKCCTYHTANNIIHSLTQRKPKICLACSRDEIDL